MEKKILVLVVVLMSAVLMMRPSANAAVAQNRAIQRPTTGQVLRPTTVQDVRLKDLLNLIGYRGTNGWKFANFGTPTIGWNVFRDYFTPSAVEYSNGTHRPSAQAWYDSAYKGVGGGGDCFGMSLRSVRTRLKEWNGLYSSWWPSHLQSTVWGYAQVPEVEDSIREDQAGQLCAQNAALINDRWNHQTSNQAYDFIKAAIATHDAHQQPVMCMWRGGGSGHAIIAYQTEEVGNDHRILVYDNNKPYSPTEANDGDSLAHVYNSSNTFSYNYWAGFAADKVCAFKFNELTPVLPLLPASAGGPTAGLSAGCTVVVCDSLTAIKQITDEAGHTFFSGNQENRNPGTRIPDSMRFIPLSGADMPADYPAIFIFNNSQGRSLTFDVEQNSPTAIRFFTPGLVTSLKFQSGRFKLIGLLHQDQALLLLNPSAMNLADVSLISVQRDNSERMFQVQGVSGIKQDSLGIQLSPDTKGIVIEGKGSAAKFNMNIRNYTGDGNMQQTSVQNLSLAANQRGLINIQDFNQLKNIVPKLEIRP